MSALTTIRELICRMRSEEIKVTRDFLIAFSTRGAASKNLSLDLFDVLVKEMQTGEVLSADKIELYLYGSYENSGFVRLVIRLLDKLEESLLLEVNLNRKGAYSEQARVLYQVRKQLSTAQLIYYRGGTTHAVSLFQAVLKMAEKYEFFEEYAAASRCYMQVLLYTESMKEYEAIRIKHDKALRALQGIRKAEYYYNRLGAKLEYTATGAGLKTLERQITELQFELTQTRTANVGYYLTFLEIQYYQEKKHYKSASKVLREQLQLVQHPALNSDNANGLVLLNNGWNEIYLHRLKSAEKYVSDALLSFGSSAFITVFQCHLVLFYIHYYTSQLDSALKKLDFLDQEDATGQHAGFRSGKRNYLRACTLFLQRDHAEVNNLLRELNPIENDDEGWNTHLRILYILNDIELGELENAFNRVENFRKHLEKLSRKDTINSRVALIFELLRALSQSNFDFAKARNKKQEELNQLKQEENGWQILSPELIVFHQWFESKLYKKAYQQTLPAYREPIAAN